MLGKIAIGFAAATGGFFGMAAIGQAITIDPTELEGNLSENRVVVQQWIDGDTVDTDRGRIRLIGIDAADVNRCPDIKEEARLRAESLAPVGEEVIAVRPAGVDNVDKYGRYLRYIETPATVDVGRELIYNDLADARYDSQDGYDYHPFEDLYREADTPGSVNDKGLPSCPVPVNEEDEAGNEDDEDSTIADEVIIAAAARAFFNGKDDSMDMTFAPIPTNYGDSYQKRKTDVDALTQDEMLLEPAELVALRQKFQGCDSWWGRHSCEKANYDIYDEINDWHRDRRYAEEKGRKEAEAEAAAEKVRKEREAEERREAEEAAKFDPRDNDRDGKVSEFENANHKYGLAWDRYMANKTPENKRKMEYWNQKSSDAAVREIDPSYTGGGSGSGSGSSGGGDGNYCRGWFCTG